MTTTGLPLVSVIVPAYNAEQYLRASLLSVLHQSYRHYEVIVVDDGSTDGTKAVAESVEGPIRYIAQRNQGPSAARNLGIRTARGALICFLDADDCWVSDKLATQVEFMEANPQIGLMFTDADEFDEHSVQCPSLLSKSRFYPEIANGSPIRGAFGKLLEENYIPTSTVMARAACFADVGDFDPALKCSEDRDMWSRIAARYQIAAVPPVTARKRVVASSISRDVETTLRSRILLWTKARRLFPALTPLTVVNALLAGTYLQLGYVLLDKGRLGDARRFALQALTVSRRAHEWLMAIALIGFSFVGKRFADHVFGTARRVRAARQSRVLTA